MASKQVPVDSAAQIDNKQADGTHEIAPDLSYQCVMIANVIYYGVPGSRDVPWVQIDAGVGSA